MIYYDPTGSFNILSGEDWKKLANDVKEVTIGIADGTMRYVSGGTYQTVDDFTDDVKWACNNSEYLGAGATDYFKETASNVKQTVVGFIRK